MSFGFYTATSEQKKQIKKHQIDLRKRLGLQTDMLPYSFDENELMISSNPEANGQMKLTWVNKLFQKYEEDINKINNKKKINFNS